MEGRGARPPDLAARRRAARPAVARPRCPAARGCPAITPWLPTRGAPDQRERQIPPPPAASWVCPPTTAHDERQIPPTSAASTQPASCSPPRQPPWQPSVAASRTTPRSGQGRSPHGEPASREGENALAAARGGMGRGTRFGGG
nr:translation initiation factor IF-2-like [Aegilops tauschii subsp. strangulata]